MAAYAIRQQRQDFREERVKADKTPPNDRPTAKRNQRRSVALSRYHFEAVPLSQHLPIPHGEQSRDDDHEDANCAGDAIFRKAAALWANLKINEGAEHVDSVSKTKDGRDVECRYRDRHDIDHRRQDSRHRQRERDAAQGPAEAHPVYLSGFFQGRIHRAKHLGGQNKSKRGQTQPLHKTHSNGGRDIDGSAFKAEKIHQPSVQNTDSRDWQLTSSPSPYRFRVSGDPGS